MVGHVEAPGVDSRQQRLGQIGKALGREIQARLLVAQVEAATGFFQELGFAGVTDTVDGLEGQDGRANVSADATRCSTPM